MIPMLQFTQEKPYQTRIVIKNLPLNRQQMPLSNLKACRLIETYTTGPYKIRIYETPGQTSELLYVVHPDIHSLQLKQIIEEKAQTFWLNPQSSKELFPTFQELVETRIDEAKALLKTGNLALSEIETQILAQLIAYRSMNLMKTMPFLLDENVDEVFLDNPHGFLYIDHRNWGRCRTNVKLPQNEISALKTRLRAESGLRLDAMSPSLKTELLTKEFQARFSIDIPPLSVDGVHLDIRKIRRRYFTIPELIFNGTLTPKAAAYLYFCLIRKRNITVIGEPGSGKTTLINALDLLTPPNWRKITVEDVIESISQTQLGNHQTRLKVKPFEAFESEARTKSTEIIKLLHRSPDWIYLGEIQTAEHSQAMFHALAAGLKGLQTCHAASPEQVIIRWITHHQVPLVCMFDLDLIVQIKKLRGHGRDERKVVKICEIIPPKEAISLSISTVNVQDVFMWDPAHALLELNCDLTRAPVFQKIAKLEAIDNVRFYDELNIYEKIFNYLACKQVFDVRDNVAIFHCLQAMKMREEQLGTINWEAFIDAQDYLAGLVN